MSAGRLAGRGPSIKPGAKLPGLQSVRIEDAQTQKAFDALREWVEVRLGSRGDPYEKAVTLRELERALQPLQVFMEKLAGFDGTAGRLRGTQVAALPAQVSVGAFLEIDGAVYVGTSKGWKKVTLTAP
jgi:hypothetical protein